MAKVELDSLDEYTTTIGVHYKLGELAWEPPLASDPICGLVVAILQPAYDEWFLTPTIILMVSFSDGRHRYVNVNVPANKPKEE